MVGLDGRAIILVQKWPGEANPNLNEKKVLQKFRKGFIRQQDRCRDQSFELNFVDLNLLHRGFLLINLNLRLALLPKGFQKISLVKLH